MLCRRGRGRRARWSRVVVGSFHHSSRWRHQRLWLDLDVLNPKPDDESTLPYVCFRQCLAPFQNIF
jgi:hypothetical protein